MIPELVNEILEWGFHPPILQMSTGIIVPKPNKQDYTNCASFRVITLIQTFSKIIEQIVNTRLMDIAYKEYMYCINQTGSVPKRSTVDAVMSLQHLIKEAQFAKQKMSTIFLDAKGGFDNIDHSKLMGKLKSNGRVPAYILKWIHSFVRDQKCHVGIPGESSTFTRGRQGNTTRLTTLTSPVHNIRQVAPPDWKHARFFYFLLH